MQEERQFDAYVAKDRRFGPFTFDFLIADDVGKSWYDGSPDQSMPERQWCFEHIRQGFTILDCGSHHGMMTVLFALMTGPSGRVIAWDALPENAETATANAALNNCMNVIVHGRDLGDKHATVYYAPNRGNVMVAFEETNINGTREINVVPLDDDIQPGLKIDFVKIDVEGSELSLLQGAKAVLRQRPIIDLELHNFAYQDRKATLDTMFRILDYYGYIYEVLPEVIGAIVKCGTTIDTTWLTRFDNPHVFCTPAVGRSMIHDGLNFWPLRGLRDLVWKPS
jgi:FkbM family methyltransferase